MKEDIQGFADPGALEIKAEPNIKSHKGKKSGVTRRESFSNKHEVVNSHATITNTNNYVEDDDVLDTDINEYKYRLLRRYSRLHGPEAVIDEYRRLDKKHSSKFCSFSERKVGL
eukprot:Awhi_evm1s7658